MHYTHAHNTLLEFLSKGEKISLFSSLLYLYELQMLTKFIAVIISQYV